MKLLLVDDETRVLDGLERMLMQCAPEEWEVLTAASGREALEILRAEPIDVIVSDMRMPGMDGAELLGLVHAEHPGVVRLVLSGQMGEEAALRAVPHAHQFLSKPCGGEVLCDAIARALHLREALGDEVIRRQLGSLDRLPPVPATYAELTRLLSQPDADLGPIADLVARDPALAAKILQLVNSSFFSRGGTVTDLKAAVARLGLRTLASLALAVGAFRPEACRGDLDGEALVERAAHAGALARALAPPVRAHDAFIAGLLADVGWIALCAASPERFGRLPLRERSSRDDERAAGLDHAAAGAYLLGLWGLPTAICQAVGLHHEAPLFAREPVADLPSLAYVATRVADGETPDPAFVAALGLTERLAKVLP
ncbi:MAG: HDOD domain-containing protein [Sandaracinaceae bacterium]|nr:HDOD domain-containing protein [Sandaracinaceae bacterium]